MPKTKGQDLFFSVIMVCCMVYCMTVFNNALDFGLSYSLFPLALQRMWVEVVIAFFLQRYAAGPNARRIVRKLHEGGTMDPVLTAAVMAVGNVMIMAPVMTFLISGLHNGFNTRLPILWLKRVVFNFPFALCIQTVYVGPFVRFLYRRIAKAAGWL
jgi:hypothetical protein